MWEFILKDAKCHPKRQANIGKLIDFNRLAKGEETKQHIYPLVI
jgi:hypothetical protein